MKRLTISRLIFVAGFLVLAMYGWGQRVKEPGLPKNVIILIGDGMGLSQFSVPYHYAEKEPVFTQFPVIGLVKTSSASHIVTESAGASTAMFCGEKTYNVAIGVNTDTFAIRNLAEIVSEKGYLTGVISTSSLTDATPAGFYAHEMDRQFEYYIARDLIASDINFFAGGGLQFFIDSAGRDLFAENNIEAEFTNLKKIRKPEPGKRYGFILAQDGMPPMLNGRGDFLPRAVDVSLDFLSRSENGFILMAEGSQMDWAGHSNNAEYMITEMLDFEQAVKEALKFAKKDKHTLVIVTADHETGGFTLGAAGKNGYNADYKVIDPSFSNTNHSAALVPLLAYGPGADRFSGIYENTEIFHRILELLKIKNFRP